MATAEATAEAPASPPLSSSEFGQQLKAETSAVRFRVEKFGTRKALNLDQRDKAAEIFHAETTSITAGKKLIDSRDPAYRAVTRLIAQAKAYWIICTVPYPEPGIRLINKTRIEEFDAHLNRILAELDKATAELAEQFQRLKDDAKERLGDLYNPADYPDSLGDKFRFRWEYPTLAVPEYLKQLNPLLYERECQRLDAQFADAVMLHEQEFVDGLSDLVGHLVERLTASEDGKQKTLKASTVENFTEFFDRFASLGVGNEAILSLTDQAKQAMAGIEIDQLRKDGAIRDAVKERLSGVQQVIDAMLVDRPTRAISLEDEEN